MPPRRLRTESTETPHATLSTPCPPLCTTYESCAVLASSLSADTVTARGGPIYRWPPASTRAAALAKGNTHGPDGRPHVCKCATTRSCKGLSWGLLSAPRVQMCNDTLMQGPCSRPGSRMDREIVGDRRRELGARWHGRPIWAAVRLAHHITCGCGEDGNLPTRARRANRLALVRMASCECVRLVLASL